MPLASATLPVATLVHRVLASLNFSPPAADKRLARNGRREAAMQVVSLPTLDDLRQYVRKTLCEHDNLDLEDSPFFEGKITRHGEMCGLFFQVQGPRLLKVYALWAAEEHRILFYGALGNRFAEIRVSDAPGMDKLAA